MTQIYPERITQARELLGLTKTELASALDVSPAAVAQWENGTKNPAAENLAQLSLRLGFPVSVLSRPAPSWLGRKGPISFRAAKSAETRRTNLKAEQLALLICETYAWLAKKVRIPTPNLPELIAEGERNLTPEEAAVLCRRHWGLGNRPILKLGELLETNGVIVARAQFSDDRIDAFSCLIDGRPFVLLGSEKEDRARSRFDAAHELGHLVMHQHMTARHLTDLPNHKDLEDEANRFAAAFLLPAEAFRMDVVDVSLSSLMTLKERWGVSVQAMVYRCYSLGMINDVRKQELFRQMSGKGWRKAKGEPFDDLVPEIRSSIGRLSLELLEQRGIMKSSELSGEIPMPIEVYMAAFSMDRERFEIDEENVINFDLGLLPSGDDDANNSRAQA